MTSSYAASAIDEIIGMGFSKAWAEFALIEASGDSEAALEFIFDHTDEMDELISAQSDITSELATTNDLGSYHDAVDEPVPNPILPSPHVAVVVGSDESDTPTPSALSDEGLATALATASLNIIYPEATTQREPQPPLNDDALSTAQLDICDLLPPVPLVPPSTEQPSPVVPMDMSLPPEFALPSVPTAVDRIDSALPSNLSDAGDTVASVDSPAVSVVEGFNTSKECPPIGDAALMAAAEYSPAAQRGEWVCLACTYINPAPDVCDSSSDSNSGSASSSSGSGVCAMCSAGQGATFSAAQAAEALSDGGGRGYEVEDEAVARQREEEDRVLAEQLAEPRVECVVCMDDVPISDAFTLDCAASHRYCFPCVRRQVTLSLAEKKVAACLLCNHAITQVEVRQLFGEHSSELAAHLDAEIGNVLASNGDLWIGCPQANCQAFVEATTPGVPERCQCSTCGFVFCSRCKGLFHGVPLVAASSDHASNGNTGSSTSGSNSSANHSGITFADEATTAAAVDNSPGGFVLITEPSSSGTTSNRNGADGSSSSSSSSSSGSRSRSGSGLTCGEAAETARRWYSWRNGGRNAFMARRSADLHVAQEKFDAATHSAMRRFADLEADEAWKEENCRLCPHCSKPIFKVDGCNTVTCGRDAADKGGGNRQDGCGKNLDWKSAKPYKRSGADKARLPKTLADVDPERAREVKHHVYVDDGFPPSSGGVGNRPPPMDRQTSSEYRIKCEACLSDIIGPRFTCVHCPGKFECCLECSSDDGKVMEAKPSHDPAAHAFQIFFEDVSAVAEGVGPTTEPSPQRSANDDGANGSNSSSASDSGSPIANGSGLRSQLRNFRDAAENAILGNPPPDGRRSNRPNDPCNPS